MLVSVIYELDRVIMLTAPQFALYIIFGFVFTTCSATIRYRASHIALGLHLCAAQSERSALCNLLRSTQPSVTNTKTNSSIFGLLHKAFIIIAAAVE